MILFHTGTHFSRESIEIILAEQEKNGTFLFVTIKKNTDRTCTLIRYFGGLTWDWL